MRLCAGTYRFVVVAGRFAFKVPRFRYWGTFLAGLLMNVGETLRWRARGAREPLCPVLAAIPGGWLVVMTACEPVRLEELTSGDRARFVALGIELRAENLGRLPDGRIVAVDYPRQSDVVYDRDGERDESRRAGERFAAAGVAAGFRG